MDGLAEQGGGFPAQHLGHGWIDKGHFACGVRPEDAFAGRVQDQFHLAAQVRHRCFRPFAFGDVLGKMHAA
jgi:hypothetical protein